MKLCALSFFLFFRVLVYAQNADTTNAINISLLQDSEQIKNFTQIFVDSTGTFNENNIPGTAWHPLANFTPSVYIPGSWITKKIYLKFTIENNSDTDQAVYFIAGMYIRSNSFYKLDANGQPKPIKNESQSDGFQALVIQPQSKQTFINAFYFTKRLHNYLAPQLVTPAYLDKYQKLLYYRNYTQHPVGYLLSGILLMMIFFTGANYLLNRKKEFLYNCLYSTCLFLLIFLTTLLERRSGVFSSLFREYIDFMLLAGGTVFYIAFTRKFLDTKTHYSLLNRIFVFEEKLVISILVIFSILVFFTNNFNLQELVENSFKVIALLIGILYIVIALAQKNKLMNYLAIGNLFLIFFSIISFLLIINPISNKTILGSSMFYYEIGVVCELVSFLLGLTYKNRIELVEKTMEQETLKRDAEKQIYETKLAVMNAQQEERNRISADMHDDLGAGVTAIRLYSELAKKRIEKGSIPEIDRISSSANDLLNNMNAIIWTMSSSNDTLDNMVAYIRSYALEYFENTGLNCHTHVDDNLPNISVSGDVRRNIYLVVKEALNNILKHAEATEVYLTLKKSSDGLLLHIQDNGKGIDFNNLRKFGNGLTNMKKRMEERNISFSIENNNGTQITLHYKMEA